MADWAPWIVNRVKEMSEIGDYHLAVSPSGTKLFAKDKHRTFQMFVDDGIHGWKEVYAIPDWAIPKDEYEEIMKALEVYESL